MVKTITLTGTETAVTGLDGAHAHIRNDGAEIIYAAKSAGLSAGADGVIAIPAGNAAALYGISGAVYISGAGAATVVTSDYVESPFKASAQAGGSGADEVARAAISSHAGNAEVHVSAEEKAAWNDKAEVSDISNPNLLINPDFSINQRGQSYYEGTGYSVDRWKGYFGGEKVNVTQDGITVEVADNQQLYTDIDIPVSAGTALCASIKWRLEGEYSSVSVIGRRTDGTYELIMSAQNQSAETVTTVCTGTAQNDYTSLRFSFGGHGTVKPYWAKLELGGAETPYYPPDPATELLKCQRYYQIRSTGDIAAVDLRPSMRTIIDIKQRSDENYEYIAEL